MSAPAAVRKQVKQAEEFLQSLESGEQPEEAKAKPETPEEEKPTAVEAEPVSPEGPDTSNESDQGGDPAPPSEDFEHKYSVLKGKYDKEVPTLHMRLREQDSKIEQLEQMVAQFSEAQETAAPTLSSSVITPEIEEEYGSDLIDLMRKIAEESFQQGANSLKNDVQQLSQQVGGVSETVSRSAREKLYAKLDSEIENWRDVNKDPEFIGWLNEEDPYSGNVRANLLKKAFAENSANRVLQFFKGFLNENAVVNSVSDTGSSSEAGSPKVDANRLVAPGKQRQGKKTSSAHDEKQQYTQREIADFYQRVREGEYKKNPEEKDRIERLIFQAVKEGRVVGNQVPVSNAAF